MDNALDRGSDESQSPSLFTDAEEAKLSPDVPPISISQAPKAARGESGVQELRGEKVRSAEKGGRNG